MKIEIEIDENTVRDIKELAAKNYGIKVIDQKKFLENLLEKFLNNQIDQDVDYYELEAAFEQYSDLDTMEENNIIEIPLKDRCAVCGDLIDGSDPICQKCYKVWDSGKLNENEMSIIKEIFNL